jgi:hypothetical protein
MRTLSEEALRNDIKAYEDKQDDILLQDILLNYYEPHKESYSRNYAKNFQAFQCYEWCYGNIMKSITDGSDKIIWASKDIIIVFKTMGKTFSFIERQDVTLQQSDVPVLQNALFKEQIQIALDQTEQNGPITWMQSPVYLFYTNKYYLSLLMQLVDLSPIIKRERVIFTIGLQAFRKAMEDDQAVLPSKILNVGTENQNLKSIIEYQMQRNYDYAVDLSLKIHELYRRNENQITSNITSKKPRVLFITSRFTTVLQHHIRDCMLACQQMGLVAAVHKEKSNIHRNGASSYLNIVNEFQPDIIFIIDYFRLGRELYIPPEIRVVTWIQDPLSHIMDETTPSKLKENDFILNHLINYEPLKKINYHACNIMNAPMRANDEIYTIRELPEQEQKMYAADICLLAHGTDYREIMNEILGALKDGFEEDDFEYIKEVFKEICINYYIEVYEERTNIKTKKACEQYLEVRFVEKGITFSVQAIDFISTQFFNYLKGCVFRSVLAEWLLDGGFTNLKLYGRDWKNHPRLRDFAMGIAQNGEEVSKILQCSKMILGTNPYASGAARVYETFLSGSFYLGNYINPKYDITDVRKILQEDSEIVFYNGKQDLYDKINYYLEHSEERQLIAKRARDKILQTHTFRALMEKTINWVAEQTEVSSLTKGNHEEGE